MVTIVGGGYGAHAAARVMAQLLCNLSGPHAASVISDRLRDGATCVTCPTSAPNHTKSSRMPWLPFLLRQAPPSSARIDEPPLSFPVLRAHHLESHTSGRPSPPSLLARHKTGEASDPTRQEAAHKLPPTRPSHPPAKRPPARAAHRLPARTLRVLPRSELPPMLSSLRASPSRSQ